MTAAADDIEATRATFVKQYERELANPWRAAERGYLDAVIEPSETRPKLIKALHLARTKRIQRPPRKHGNIPL